MLVPFLAPSSFRTVAYLAEPHDYLENPEAYQSWNGTNIEYEANRENYGKQDHKPPASIVRISLETFVCAHTQSDWASEDEEKYSKRYCKDNKCNDAQYLLRASPTLISRICLHKSTTTLCEWIFEVCVCGFLLANPAELKATEKTRHHVATCSLLHLGSAEGAETHIGFISRPSFVLLLHCLLTSHIPVPLLSTPEAYAQ